MDDKLKGLLMGAFAGDALSLGAHWIYNPAKIFRVYGRITDYLDPDPAGYHGGKRKGEFTHYGDQMLVLLDSVTGRGAFDLGDFSERWRSLWPEYSGYVDGATKGALAKFAGGTGPEHSGSTSNDLAGASRMAPLFLATVNDEERAVLAARAQTAMTHGDRQVIDAAEFFARVTVRVHAGAGVSESIEAVADLAYRDLPAREWVDQAVALVDEETVPAMQQCGLTCHVPEAFPATVLLLLKFSDDLEKALIENVMAGGDSAARGMLAGMVLGAAHGSAAIPPAWIAGMPAAEGILSRAESIAGGTSASGAASTPPADQGIEKIVFSNEAGEELAGRLEHPAGEPAGYAIFAHCFTCSKDVAAATRISRGLSSRGIAVLRFDFTGLGNSDGDFANTNFSSNVQDLVSAADHLRKTGRAPVLLVGHSLGGAAVLAAANKIPGIEGVVTIGAPSDPGHVEHLFAGSVEEIEASGVAEVNLAGRKFSIKKQFVDDLREQALREQIATLGKALLIMHSPTDAIVGIDNARAIYEAARHPKSFISLDGADHLLSNPADSEYVAEMIAAWSSRLVNRG